LETTPRAAKVAGGLAVSALGGAACAWLGTPLPWMIGSMFAMAAIQLAGAGLDAPPGGRDAGMLVVGVSLGLYFTVPVVREVASFWPWFLFLGFAAIGFGAASALVLMRVGGLDRATAYFGSMPGGASEMALVGERFGAGHAHVALLHSLRLLVVVTVVPVSITLAGFSATEDYRPVTVGFDAPGLALLLGAAVMAGFAARRLRAPTPFTMGPLFLTIAITVAGVQLSSVPAPLSNAAQVLLGCALGSRFDRGFVSTAPRLVLAFVPAIAVMVALATLVGWLISATSGAYLGTALLSAAPGGIAEMSITAKVLRIGVAFVTAAHVVRYLIVVLFTIPVYRALEWARLRAGRIG
jgi:membrane AbrB-like protein